MKLTLCIATSFLLLSCKPDDVAKETSDTPPPTSRSKEQALLLNEKLDLTRKLDELVSNSQIDPDGEMQTVIQENRQAITDRLTILNTHPNLKILNGQLKDWRRRALSARARKSAADSQLAANKIREINSKLHNLSKELPAIREAQDRISLSEKQIKKLRRSLAEKTPEGQKIVAQIEELEQLINSTE